MQNMFAKKSHQDVKKSTSKIQDIKKDSVTRLKHLKIVLEHVDLEEAKSLFEANYSHVYYILYDSFVQAEANLRQRVHKAHREDLDGALWLMKRVLCFLPELLSRGWQAHSLGRLLSKVLHPANNQKLWSEGVRLFLLWYQALGENAPKMVHNMYASLVPGLGSVLIGETGHGSNGPSDMEFNPTELLHHPNFSLQKSSGASVFHDTAISPVHSVDILPLIPSTGHDRSTMPNVFLEILLDSMVQTSTSLIWRERCHTRHMQSFSFLLDRFRQVYLPQICPSFNARHSLYNPVLDLPEIRHMNKKEEHLSLCRVVLIKWIVSYTHDIKKTDKPVMQPQSLQSEEDSSPLDSIGLAQANANFQNSTSLVKEVLYSTRENINFIHEIYRQAFLLGFAHSAAIRKSITVYKDWIQMTLPDLPPFLLEPTKAEIATNSLSHDSESHYGKSKENLSVKAGLQNVLQVFVTQAANVFLLIVPEDQLHLLEEQTDTCKRVLNIYRYMVMHVHMEAATWEQLLLVLLQVTSLVLTRTDPRRKSDTLGGTLAQAIFQTLIVTWIKANLNVSISPELWAKFLAVLSSLTQWEELIKEWAKTMETLTRVLARHVYSLDLADLPLDRLNEHKGKRSRRKASTRNGPMTKNDMMNIHTPSIGIKSDNEVTYAEDECDDFMSYRSSRIGKLSRSYSEGNISNIRKHKNRSKHTHPRRNRAMEHVLNNSTNCTELSSTSEITQPSSSSQGLPFVTHRIIHQQPGLRKALSLDSARDSLLACEGGDSDGETRSASPSPSSGIDGGSIKDSPMQIDVLGGDNSIDNSECDGPERRSVISGGQARGWLPDVASILWSRMLGALGNVNNIENPQLHAQLFEYLVHLMETLIKMKENIGVPNDKISGPLIPDLVPPIGVLAAWCYGAIDLFPNNASGNNNPIRLLCLIARHGGPMSKEQLPMFYSALHKGLCGEDKSIGNTVIKYLGGPRFLSLLLPGHTLLLLDLVHAATVILTSSDFASQIPRYEAASLLGSLLCLPNSALPRPVLQPASPHITLMECPDLQEHVLNVILRCARREPTARARCIALSALGQFVYQQLSLTQPSPRIKEAVLVLLQALKFKHRVAAHHAAEALSLTAGHQSLVKHFPDLPAQITKSIGSALTFLSPALNKKTTEQDKNLVNSLTIYLGEFCMGMTQEYMLHTPKGEKEPLLLSVFRVLYALSMGLAPTVVAPHAEIEENDFNFVISVDDMVDIIPLSLSPSSSRGSSAVNSIKLCARTVLMHLVNHIGHFPMSVGAARLSSLVDELDDPHKTDGDLNNLVISGPNLQLFLLKPGLICSMIELPALKLPGGGATAGLLTASMQVRMLLRDLSGKASWDTTILYCELENIPHPIESHETKVQENNEEPISLLMPAISMPNMSAPPRDTLRHRPLGQLPLPENSACDLDQLEDLLQYIGHTSPECLVSPNTPLNGPAAPPIDQALEAQIISSILGQRAAEKDYLNREQQLTSLSGPKESPPKSPSSHTPFQHCRLLYSQLGLSGWSCRTQLQLLSRSDKLLRELRNLDTQRCRETHKVAVIYVSSGQEDKNTILRNSCGSQPYEMFVSALGWEVELESHTGFLGGLQRQGSTGQTAPYYATSFLEVIFHVSTRMPCDTPEDMLSKTRHLGNDEVHIVWSEHYRDYRRDILPTEFCDVLIVIYPLPSGLFRISVNKKPDVPCFGPIHDEAVVGGSCLAGLIRSTAINASRAKRTGLPGYQQYYEERLRSLDIVAGRYSEKTTFEDFSSKVFCPSGTNVQQIPHIAHVASASVESSRAHIPPIKDWSQHSEPTSSDSNMQSVDLQYHPSPRPLKRMAGHFKSNPLHSSNTSDQDSPTLGQRRYR